MRKITQVKKQFYLFHLPYMGKPENMSDWYLKVESRTTQTLKFLNSARLLRIIGYDPTQYINKATLNTARSQVKTAFTPKSPLKPITSLKKEKS
jgi:hypothetical protein